MSGVAVEFGALRSYRVELLVASLAQNLLSLALPIAILQVYDRIIPNSSDYTLAIFVIALGVALILDFLLSIGRAYIAGWAGARLQHALACKAISKLFRSDLKQFESETAGIHLQRLKAVDTAKNAPASQAMLLMVDLPFVLLFFMLIGLIAGPLALVPVVVVLLLAATARIAGDRLGRALEARREIDDRRYNFMIEVLRAIHTVKALGMESMMIRRYERLQASSAEASYDVSESSTWVRSTGQMFSQLMTVAVGAYGSTLVIDGALTVGGLAACTLLASRSAQPMMRVLSVWTQVQNFRISESQIKAIMDMPAESMQEAPDFRPIQGNLQLEHVAFSYSTPDQAILSSVNLRLDSGQTIAITGVNGSGKSTLLGLMRGLLIPSEGRVLMDGRNVWDHDATSLRSQVVYLPQKPLLFQGTILENMTMFRGDAYVDAAMQMAERLGLHEAIGKMARGYETRVEHAANAGLPGGLRQRIALVRALTLVDDPKLILFDEANTYLDHEGDALLLSLLREYEGKCSIVIVSHRPSYLALADHAYLIRDKRLERAPTGVRVAMDRLQRAFR